MSVTVQSAPNHDFRRADEELNGTSATKFTSVNGSTMSSPPRSFGFRPQDPIDRPSTHRDGAADRLSGQTHPSSNSWHEPTSTASKRRLSSMISSDDSTPEGSPEAQHTTKSIRGDPERAHRFLSSDSGTPEADDGHSPQAANGPSYHGSDRGSHDREENGLSAVADHPSTTQQKAPRTGESKGTRKRAFTRRTRTGCL